MRILIMGAILLLMAMTLHKTELAWVYVMCLVAMSGIILYQAYKIICIEQSFFDTQKKFAEEREECRLLTQENSYLREGYEEQIAKEMAVINELDNLSGQDDETNRISK